MAARREHPLTPVGVPQEHRHERKDLRRGRRLLAAAAIIPAKAARQRPAEAAVVARGASPSVILVADPREADSECGCGQIIRRDHSFASNCFTSFMK